MSTLQRLQATYDIDGVLVHRPARSQFGTPYFGEIAKRWCKPDRETATGFELAESILIAQRHLIQVQEAIANMQRILDTAEPVEEKTP
jgi:hypothetical protein